MRTLSSTFLRVMKKLFVICIFFAIVSHSIAQRVAPGVPPQHYVSFRCFRILKTKKQDFTIYLVTYFKFSLRVDFCDFAFSRNNHPLISSSNINHHLLLISNMVLLQVSIPNNISNTSKFQCKMLISTVT